jgi:hypothetical protein
LDPTLADRFRQESCGALYDALIDLEVHSRHASAIRSLQDRYAGLNEEAELLFETIAEELRERAAGISCPFAEAEDGEEAEDPLFDSSRDYVTQIDHYRSHKALMIGSKRCAIQSGQFSRWPYPKGSEYNSLFSNWLKKGGGHAKAEGLRLSQTPRTKACARA